MRRTVIAQLALLIVLAGCTGMPYQPIGTDERGGYSSSRLGESRFLVSFEGTSDTSVGRVRDYALLRAAEITHEYNYKLFSISSENQGSSLGGVAVSFDRGYTPGPLFAGSSYGRTRYSIQIVCFDAPSNTGHQGKLYDPKDVISEIKQKYKLP
jgi:hypothetical protein